MADTLEATFQAAIEHGKIHGAIICATDTAGGFVYNRALGQRVLLSGEKKPHQLDDIVYLASTTKLITTIAALQCVEDGLLTLTGDLSSIAPELAEKKVLTGWSDAEEPILEATTGFITLEMLLTHTAGLSYFFLSPNINKWEQKYNIPQEGQLRGVEELWNQPLDYQPGTRWMYGSAMDWAGLIIERVTGRTLQDYVQQRVGEPLGISEGQFYPVTREDLRARLVDLNPQDPKAVGRAAVGGNPDINQFSRGNFGGHGMFMSGSGYIEILHSLLANDGKLLQPTSVELMFKNHLTPDIEAQLQDALGPPGAYFRMGTHQRVGQGFGGLLTLEDVDGWYGKDTLTWGGGQTTMWFIDRQNDLCGFAALNVPLPTDSASVTELRNAFRHKIYTERAEQGSR
ncbi:Lovastatin esterase [Paramyrothecium foliicola]|nr:Lovastatin esterase [Paramyrothecium foliicola]